MNSGDTLLISTGNKGASLALSGGQEKQQKNRNPALRNPLHQMQLFIRINGPAKSL